MLKCRFHIGRTWRVKENSNVRGAKAGKGWRRPRMTNTAKVLAFVDIRPNGEAASASAIAIS